MESRILYNHCQPETLLAHIKIDDKQVRGNRVLLQELLAEWPDLLLRLFPNTETLVVSPLKPGYSGAGVIAVLPFFERGQGHKVVVKFGDAQQIKQEHSNYITHIQSFIG